ETFQSGSRYDLCFPCKLIVQGETHICWCEHGLDDFTEFIAEQVSHHPPISAFIGRNSKREISVECNQTFGVRFGSNHAAVTTGGTVYLKTKTNNYEISRIVPDAVIHNVIKGKRYMTWEGDVTLSCNETG